MLALNLELNSWAHRVKATWKLMALALASLVLLSFNNLILFCVSLTVVVLLYCSLGGRAVRLGLKFLRPMFWMAGLIFIYHIIFGDLAAGIKILLNLLVMISLANFVTMTTRLDDMLNVVERVASGLKFLGINPRIIAISCAMVIRFTPILALKGGYLIEAWRARSTKRVNWRILVPFCLLALDDAEHVSEALKARGGFDVD